MVFMNIVELDKRVKYLSKLMNKEAKKRELNYNLEIFLNSMNYEGRLNAELFKAIPYTIGDIYSISEANNIYLDKNYIQLIPKDSKYYKQKKALKLLDNKKAVA